MPDTILGGDFTVHYDSDNSQKRLVWTGSSDGTRTMNELYSALQSLFDNPSQMDDLVPMKADTPDIYRMQNQWFVDDTTVEHLTGGSLFSSGWIDGTTEHVLIIGYAQTTEFNAADIGRTIRGTTSTDTGTILDFNTTRNLVWIRPDVATSGGDEFDNGIESYTIGAAASGDPVTSCLQDDNTVFTDETTDANSAANGDVSIIPAAPVSGQDFGYIGFGQEFSRILIDRLGGTQASADGVTELQYSQGGNTWAALTGVTDDTGGGTTDGTAFGEGALADGDEVTFTVPSDWATDSVNGSAQLFWVRVRVATTYTTGPVFSQIFISGVGAGAFADHNRHGSGSTAGESAWVGKSTIGTIESDTHIYIAQEDPDAIVTDSQEVLVTATKGTADWWDDGQIDILLKVKESDIVIGQLPNSSPATAVSTTFARQYSKNYSHFIATALATAGGNTVVPLSTSDDLDNTTGFRNLVWDNGDTGATLVDEERLYNVGTTTAGNLDAGVQDDGGVFTDDTTDVNDTGGAGDVAVFPATEVAGDAFYFGKDNTFTNLMVDIQTQGVSSADATQWEYFDGTTWSDLEAVTGFVDDSNLAGDGAFTSAAGRHVIQWTVPTDWARTNVTNQPAAAPTNLFYVRIRIVTANYSTVPVLETAWVGGEAQLAARVADTALVTPGDASGNGDYYLIGDPISDFSDNDVVIAGTSRKSFDIAGGPTNVGPASDTTITATHGEVLEANHDIDEDGTAEPYSVDINNTTPLAVSRIYERFKYLTRRGETATASTDGQEGQFYLGNELQIEYTGQAGGAFAEGARVYDQTTDAEGIVVADHDAGATGDVILRTVRGTFTGSNILSDAPDPNQVMNTDSFVFAVDVNPTLTVVDESADALSAGAGDIDIFPGTEESTVDYFIVGAKKPFSRIVFNNAGGTAGTVGDVAWEYWNGTAWTTLTLIQDGTDAGGLSFTIAVVDNQFVDFSPPVDWRTRGIHDGSVGSSQALYMVRARVTTAYTVNPLYDDIQVEDLVTATIGSGATAPRTVAPVSSAPFGTFPGASKVFYAPGASPNTTELVGGEEQDYQTIDDDGTTKVPPNKQNMTVTNLISGDTVAVFRRTASVINKTQLTLAAGNNQSATTLVIDASIPTDNPNTANSKVRVVSSSGVEHRYRYSSFATTTFTLADTVVGGTSDGGNSNNTRLHDTSGSPFANAEVGDFIRNTTQEEVVRITNVVDSNNVDTDPLSGSLEWDGDSYDYNVLMESYGLDSAYVPIIERVADATSEANTITFASNITVRVDVRRATVTVILPFTQDATIVSTGLSIAAIRTTDDIFS